MKRTNGSLGLFLPNLFMTPAVMVCQTTLLTGYALPRFLAGKFALRELKNMAGEHPESA